MIYFFIQLWYLSLISINMTAESHLCKVNLIDIIYDPINEENDIAQLIIFRFYESSIIGIYM